MTEDQLEGIFSKAHSLNLQCGVYSIGTDEDAPGYIGLVFRDDILLDAINAYNFIDKEMGRYNKKVVINNREEGVVDFTFIIEKEPALVISVKNMELRQSYIEMFFKKQPIDKLINLLMIRYPSIHTLEESARLATITLDSGFHQPIQIHSWKAIPLGT